MVPVSATGTPSSSAVIPVAMTPEVLPWSCAVPMVVYRLMCSMDVRPAPTARAMSATVASRCRSTNSVVPSAAGHARHPPQAPAARPPRRSRLHGGQRHRPRRGPIPASVSASRAARWPSARHPARVKTPAADPATVSPSSSLVRQERTQLLVVTEPAAGLAEQVHRRVPPAADQQRVAGQGPRCRRPRRR